MGTTGRARIAPPVAIAAETPQMEMPDARGGGPFPVELEVLSGDEINHRPVNQIGLDDRAKATEQNPPRQARILQRLDADACAHDDDGGFDE